MTVSAYVAKPGQRGAVLLPGLPTLADNVERHLIPARGARLLDVDAGDEVCVIDPEGLQVAELVAFRGKGEKAEPALMGAANDGLATGLHSIVAGDAKAKTVLGQLQLNLSDASCFRAFKAGSKAGDSTTFTALENAYLLVGAPGSAMAPHTQSPATELVVYIHRQHRLHTKQTMAAPAPLAKPLIDVNIQPGTAQAYEVKAGQYVQIVDVKGRECSDFQAFALTALDRGIEREIDPTTTRSLMGTLYPNPGLFSKYFTVDHEPLLQIVQDTCGRHDSFGVACTARYYEDLGYPGHANCSDNMNAALAPYGIRERGGWPAINFFFNTQLDATNAISMDDPWSRPGDFVLLRALSDLVCVSTGCPCDVDPANGWNPTDIQVRVYDEKEDFAPAKGFRRTTDADVQMTYQTGFHESFAQYTRNFTEYNGYWLAQDFPATQAIDEYWACRERVVVTDLSPLRKFEVLGPDAEQLLQQCLTRNIRKLSTGQVVYTAMCYEHGGMIDDGTLFRLGDNNFRWIGGNDTSGQWLREQAATLGLDAWVKSSTNELCNIAVQGRHSRALLAKILWTAPTQATVDELGWFRFSIARLTDYQGMSLIISRTGYTGELGYELFCHPKDASILFDAVMHAGMEFAIKPLGLDALNMLRIESGLIFAGCEFDDTTDPYEAGIGFTVPLKSKEDDFIGRDALVRRKAGPTRKLVGLELQGNQVPQTGDCVRMGRAQIGEVTSATRSPLLGKVIALCRMDITHAEPGTNVEVGQLDGHQKRVPATVVTFPHFDPGKERAKGNYNSD
jgi:aminomethyltransferase